MPIKKDKKKAPKKRVVAKKGPSQTQSQKVIVNIHKPASKRTVSKKPTASSQPSASGYAPIAYNYPTYGSIPIPRTISAIPIPTEMPSSIREPIKASVSTQVSEPVRKSIAVQSEPEPVAMKIPVKYAIDRPQAELPINKPIALKPGQFNIPVREPVSLKLSPQKNEQKLMQNEEMLSILTQPSKKNYPQPSKKAEIPLQVNKRRNKQEMNEARQMGREDIASIQLGLTRFNNPPSIPQYDTMSDVSTTPLYEGGREVPEPPIKRTYVKSGKYSKKPKIPSLIPVVSGEEEESFYPTKPSPQSNVKFGELEPLY
jgi:hypothetical protein